jgi:hypothetical protein
MNAARGLHFAQPDRHELDGTRSRQEGQRHSGARRLPLQQGSFFVHLGRFYVPLGPLRRRWSTSAGIRERSLCVLLAPPHHDRFTFLLGKDIQGIVQVVAQDVRQPDVVGDEMSSVALEDRVVVHRWCPWARRVRLQVEGLAPVGRIALRHRTPKLRDEPALGHLNEDAVYSEISELFRQQLIVHACIIACRRLSG